MSRQFRMYAVIITVWFFYGFGCADTVLKDKGKPAGGAKDASISADVRDHFSPPLGWNSYTGYSTIATEKEFLKNIHFLSENLLKDGYNIAAVDAGWFYDGIPEQGGKVVIDEFGRPDASEYFFPSGLKAVADYAHARGVKFGIWLIRGVNRDAVDQNLPIEGTSYRLQEIADKKRRCGWNNNNYGVDMSKPGAQEYYNSLIKKYADAGVDFIKFDDIVPHPSEIQGVVKAIENCGREITLSLSPGDHIQVADSGTYKKAQMVRITSDIWDNKGSLDSTFTRWEQMQAYDGPAVGSWLDLDMVCFGRLYLTRNGGWMCKFTEDQKRTFMIQRALAASPIMLGGVLYSMDEFSLSLFKNSDILECNQNGVIGHLVHRQDKLDIWKTPKRGDADSGWIGIFNRDSKQILTVEKSLEELGLLPDRKYTLKNLWTRKELPSSDTSVFEIPADGVVFLRYQQVNDMIRIACVGDSITQGSGIIDQDRDSYPSVLGRLLGNQYKVFNCGRSGATATNMGDRPYLKTPQFKSATAYNPDIVIMMLGTNDSKPHIWTHKDRYSKDLTFLIDHFAALPSKPKIFLCTPAWVIMEFTDNINRETVNGQIVPIVRSIAEEKNIPLIDVYSAFKGKPELFIDGVHPNEAGAVVLAKTVAKAIESELTDSAMKSDVK